MSEKLEKNLSVLKILYEKLNSAQIPWILSGSTSLGLRKVNVPVNDIDILIHLADCEKVYEVLSEFSTTVLQGVSETDKYRSCRNLYAIAGVEIDVMGDFQYKLADGSWSKIRDLSDYEIIKVSGIRLRVLPLIIELKEYQSMGRHDKAKAIKSRMDELRQSPETGDF